MTTLGISSLSAFAEYVLSSNLKLWEPSQVPNQHGLHLILGVSPLSIYDLQLLDALDGKCTLVPYDQYIVSVFDWTSLNPDVLLPYGVAIKDGYHTPLLALWHDGILAELSHGYTGRRFVCQLFNLNPDDILAII